MINMVKLPTSKSELFLRVAKGHFATSHSHINYYIDVTTQSPAMGMLNRPASDIVAVTMPCFGTTARTKSNAELLAERMGATLKIIDISQAVRRHFTDIGQSMENHDVTFENGQARERTQVFSDPLTAQPHDPDVKPDEDFPGLRYSNGRQ